MINNYLKVLEQSLLKKSDVLDRIQEVNSVQCEMLKKYPMDMELYDNSVDEKDMYINELTSLDEGFESLYDKVKQELLTDRLKYTNEINRLKVLISCITEKSVAIQAQEIRNKNMLDDFFKKERQELKRSRKSNEAAYGYYQNMNQTDVQQSIFLDKKK